MYYLKSQFNTTLLYAVVLYFAFAVFGAVAAVAGVRVTDSPYVYDMKTGSVYESRGALIAAFQSKMNQCLAVRRGLYHKFNRTSVVNDELYGDGDSYGDSECKKIYNSKTSVVIESTNADIALCSDGSFPESDGSCPMPNYCDTVQYQLDYDLARQQCESLANDNQTAVFNGSCDRENEMLVTECKIDDISPPNPPPELCDDGSAPPCDGGDGGGGDGGDGGGGSGGGGDGGDSGGGSGGGSGDGNIDLSGLEALIKNNTDVNKSLNAGNEVYWDSQTKSLSSLDKKAREALIKQDVTNSNLNKISGDSSDSRNSLANIESLTRGLSADIESVSSAVNKESSINHAENLSYAQREILATEKVGFDVSKAINDSSVNEIDAAKAEIDRVLAAHNANSEKLMAQNKNLSSISDQLSKENAEQLAKAFSDSAAQTGAGLTDINQGVKDINQSIRDGNNILGNLGNLNVDSVGSSSCVVGGNCESFIPTDYPDGVSGVFEDFYVDVQTSTYLTFLDQFLFKGTSSPTYPVWEVDLSGVPIGDRYFGVYDMSIPTYVWSIVRAFLMFSCVMQCRRIIFGG